MPKIRYKKDDHWEETRIDKTPFRIGRGLENDLAIDSFFISRVHCELVAEKDHWVLHDLGSKIGTKVNHKEVFKPTILNSGDILHFGDRFELLFFMDEDNTQTLRAQMPEVSKSEFRLVALNGPLANQSFPIERNLTRIGRGPHNEIRLNLDTVSTDHAEILRQGQTFILNDLNSANGTLVESKRIQRCQLAPEMVFCIDWVRFRFEDAHFRLEKTGTVLTRTNKYPALASPDDPLHKSLILHDPLQLAQPREQTSAKAPKPAESPERMLPPTRQEGKDRDHSLWLAILVLLLLSGLTAGVAYYFKDAILALLP